VRPGSEEVISIRPMQVEDVAQVQEIDSISFSTPWPKESFFFELNKNPTSICRVIEIQQPGKAAVICGMLVLWLIIDEAHIGTIAIHPDYRRRGLGSRLMIDVLNELQEKEANLVFLEVRAQNHSAQELYYQLGFKQTGVRRNYYKDTGEDALLLTIENLQQKVFE